MSTNSDLAGWGEPPVTPAEEALGALLDKVLAKIEGGEDVRPEDLKAKGSPELLERGRELIRTANLLCECAVSVWESVRPSDVEGGQDLLPGVTGANGGAFQPGKQDDPMPSTLTGKLPGMPDPLPREFRLLRLLGEGAFGKVWLAEDLGLGRHVALKTLKLPATSTLGPHVLAALQKEARHLAELDHPNIVRVHAWLEAAGEYFLVLQFVAGGSLEDRLRVEKALGWKDACRCVADVAEALAVVHKRLVHRDIKPANILWDSEKKVPVLTDFGVAALLAEPGKPAGTPMYMAPEAFDGAVSSALDVYSLSATLYRLVTGQVPFAADSIPALIVQKLAGAPTGGEWRDMPEEVEEIIRAGLAARPEDRPSMGTFTAALRSALLRASPAAPSTPPAGPSVRPKVELVVSRFTGDRYERVATPRLAPGGLSRDLKKVPPAPEKAVLRTGDRVRLEAVINRVGFLTVFNIGPTGNFNLLYPDDAHGPLQAPVGENEVISVIDVALTPPTGRERVFALWSSKPLPLHRADLISLAEKRAHASFGPSPPSRDIKRIEESVQSLPTEDWCIAFVELDHQS